MLLGGCAAKVLMTTLRGHNQFKYPVSYLFLLGLAVTVMLQTHFLNEALIKGEVMRGKRWIEIDGVTDIDMDREIQR